MNDSATVTGKGNSDPTSGAGVKVRHSLAASALLGSAIPIALAILVTTILAYLLFFASIKQHHLDELALFSKERVDLELEVFRLAEENLSILHADTLEHYHAIGQGESDRYYKSMTELLPDGTRRTHSEGFDALSETEIFIGKGVELSERAKRTLAVTDHLIAKYGLAWRSRFPNLYFVGKEDYATVLWYGESFIFGMPGDYTHLDKPYFLAGTPENNPNRENRWTSIYLDDSSYKLMVSSVTPLYIDEEFIGIFAHDIYLDELMARTIDDHPQDATNMLITNGGELLAHPNYMELITASGNSVNIKASGDDNLKTIYKLVRDRQKTANTTASTKTRSIVVEDKQYDRYLVATELGDMGWTLITEYPRNLIAKEAFNSARTVLILGAILLFVEFLVLFVVVRRKVSGPLKELGVAAHSWKSERIEGLFDKFAERKDEVGSLSREFLHLQGTIDDQFAQLRREIEVRKKAEQAVTERSNQLSDLNANLDAKVKQRTADLEREVRERSLLTAAMEHAAESIMITNSNLEIEYVNPMFEQQSGFSKEELLGKTSTELNLMRSDLAVQKEVLEALRNGEMWSGRVRNESKNGEICDEDATISPIRDEKGKVTHFVEVKRDITERLELEQQLQSAQKLESIGQLAAGIAHEINTPTQYIGDNTRFLKEAYTDLNGLIEKLTELPDDELSSEKIKELLEEADVEYLQEEIPLAVGQCLEGVERVAKIVRAMKEFSHPSKEKAPADLNQAIQSTITVAANEWKYVAAVDTDFDEELPKVNCELGEINQVVLNIIVNAAHAIEEAGRVEERGEEKGTISIKTRCVDDLVEISISDTGIGMPESVKAKIFDPFYTTKEVGKGTGQGLTIAHKVIVKNHGGTINVDSTPGKGTQFVIRLPVDSDASDSHLDRVNPAGAS